MRIQYRPDIHRTTFESVDPLHTQWDYLENIGPPATDNFSPTPSHGSSTVTVATTTTTTTESIPLDARKREYILYSRRLVRRHINSTYLRLDKNLPGAESFSGPQLVSALVRAGKDLDLVANARKMKGQVATPLWHAVQYALRGEFITLEQATIRGCGPDAISAVSSTPSLAFDAYPSPPPSVKKDRGKKKVKVKKIKKEDTPNLNTFSAKFLRLGGVESAIKEHFEILCERQNKENNTSSVATPITPKRTAPSPIAAVSAALARPPPTSCRKPDTGTLPRALHSPENEFISPIPLLLPPNFTPTGSPSPKRNKPQRREPSDPEAIRKLKRDLCSSLLRTRRMLSWERRWDKALALAQASRKLPPEPTLEFKSRSELNASGISGVLSPLRVYPDRGSEWSQRYLGKQRNDLGGTLETRAAILGQKVHRVPLPGSATLPRIRHHKPELPKEPVGGVTPSRLRQTASLDQLSGTASSKYNIKQALLARLPKRGVGSGIAYLKNLVTRLSRSRQVSFTGQLSTSAPAKHKVEREELGQLPQETTNVESIPTQTQTPLSSSKRKPSSTSNVQDLANQVSPMPQRRLRVKLERSGSGKVNELRKKLNSQTSSKEGKSRRSQRKRFEELTHATGKSTPTIAQASPSSPMLKLSPITDVNNLMDPESPLVQKKWRVEQKKSASGKSDQPPQEQNFENLGGEEKSYCGVNTAPRSDTSNDEGKTPLVSDWDTIKRQIPTRVHLKRKRANFEDLSKYGEDFLRPAKRVRTTGPLEPLSIPLPTAQCVIS